MTKDEAGALRAILAELKAIQEHAPEKTTYRLGRTESSISARLLGIIAQLHMLLGVGDEAEQPEPAE